MRHAIFAVNMLIYDYFKEFNVFQIMTIIPVSIRTEADRENFRETYGISSERLFLNDSSENPFANYFIVDAEDEENRLLNVVWNDPRFIDTLVFR